MENKTDKPPTAVSDTCTDDLHLAPEVAMNKEAKETKTRPPLQIVWLNVVLMGSLHIAAIYGIYLLPKAKTSTLLWSLVLYHLSAFGITVGAHRLWSHRSFKARLPLRILLGVFNSMAFQNDIIEWTRDHRVHHKYSETDADPHNAKRGFFFSHVGWLLVRKHSDVKLKGRQLDLSDLYADPVCRIQRKVYKPSVILLCFVIPTLVPVYMFGESWVISFFIAAVLRYCSLLNATWLVNSAAHMWGSRPYDSRINPAQNPGVAFLAAGEGFHNYHHTFPQDYSTSELGWFLNFSTLFIDFFENLGQVYDKKKVPKHFIEQRRKRTGDLCTKKSG